MLDDEDAKEIGVAAGAEDVPGKGSEAEGGDGGGMKQAEGVAPAFGKECPQENRAATKNDCRRAFRENCCASGGETSPRTTAAQTMATVNIPLKGMSVDAAWEKPIMPTVVGRRSNSQRAVSEP